MEFAMDVFSNAIQMIVPLGIFNVWFLRAGKSTRFRGANAETLKQEFAAYGLPGWFMVVAGTLKVLFALGLIFGFVWPELVRPSAIGMSVMMAGAVVMHFKVGDPITRTLPALAMLAMSAFLAFG